MPIRLLLSLLILFAAGTAGLAQTSAPAALPGAMSAAEAHAAAGAGKVVLVDIRSQEEWKDTGVPASGHAVTMHQAQASFVRQIEALTQGDKAKPLALICATGSRSSFLRSWLVKAGYTAVIDVSEGMEGGRAGRGWVRAGLPIRKWTPGASAPVAVAR